MNFDRPPNNRNTPVEIKIGFFSLDCYNNIMIDGQIQKETPCLSGTIKGGERLMIYFHDELVAKILESIKESYDCADVCNDLNRIDQAITNVRLHGNCTAAYQLGQELRQKYPCINRMVDVANSMLISAPRAKRVCSASEAIISELNQDRYGILCDTAIKKQLVHSIKEFIKGVD